MAQLVQVVGPVHPTHAHVTSVGAGQPADVTEVVRTVEADATVGHAGTGQIDGGDPLVERELAHGIQCGSGWSGGG